MDITETILKQSGYDVEVDSPSYDLYPEFDKSSATLELKGFLVQYRIGCFVYENRYRAVSANEAVGAFLVDQEDLSYSDIQSVVELEDRSYV